MNERAQLWKQEGGSGPGFRFEGLKVRKIGAQRVRMNSWPLLPAAGAAWPGEGATSGSRVRPLGGLINHHHRPCLVLKRCTHVFPVAPRQIQLRSVWSRDCVWLGMIIENINIRSLAWQRAQLEAVGDPPVEAAGGASR